MTSLEPTRFEGTNPNLLPHEINFEEGEVECSCTYVFPTNTGNDRHMVYYGLKNSQ